MKSTEFVGARLRVARRFYGLSQSELGTQVATGPTMISQVELGAKRPSDLLVQAFSDVLLFEPDFFYEPLEEEFQDSECNFRRRKTTSQILRRRVLAHGTLLSLIIGHLESILTFPDYNMPRVSGVVSNEDIERAAERCRVHWGLGEDLPITNLVRSLENAGTIVTKIWADTEKVDAFSRPGKFRGVVVLTEDKGSPSRSIFDAAHEAGHLIMHVGMPADNLVLETQADLFASALLLPRVGFQREFQRMRRIDWAHIFELKRRWRCSAAAIIRRAFSLDLIDAAQYRQAQKYIRLKGWHHGEPVEPQPEMPALLASGFAALLVATSETPYEVARRLHLTPSIMEKVTGLPVPRPSEPLAGVASLDDYRRKRS